MRRTKITPNLTVITKTVSETLNEYREQDPNYTLGDVLEQYDYFADGTQITGICTLLNTQTSVESGISGIEYADGRYAVVGVQADTQTPTWLDMIYELIKGF